MKSSKISSIFILFIVAHLNLVMPVSKASTSSDVCIMNNTIHMAHHSDNNRIHNHDTDTHHSGHKNNLHEMRTACNMDMSSPDIYFPGGEHPFTYSIIQGLNPDLSIQESLSFKQSQIKEAFATPPYNPPRFIS